MIRIDVDDTTMKNEVIVETTDNPEEHPLLFFFGSDRDLVELLRVRFDGKVTLGSGLEKAIWNLVCDYCEECDERRSKP